MRGIIVGKCRNVYDYGEDAKCDGTWLTAALTMSWSTAEAQCNPAYNADGTHKEEAASKRAANQALLGKMLPTKIDSAVYQGGNTNTADIKEEHAYITKMKQREEKSRAICEDSTNREPHYKRPNELESIGRCMRRYFSQHPPPDRPSFLKDRKQDGTYITKMEKAWDDVQY